MLTGLTHATSGTWLTKIPTQRADERESAITPYDIYVANWISHAFPPVYIVSVPWGDAGDEAYQASLPGLMVVPTRRWACRLSGDNTIERTTCSRALCGMTKPTRRFPKPRLGFGITLPSFMIARKMKESAMAPTRGPSPA
jgi:hypothetical protein